MNRKAVAREWLIFVGLSGLGFGILFVLAILFAEDVVSDYVEVLFTSVEWQAWGVVMGPYLLVQFSRSVVWAIRVIRH